MTSVFCARGCCRAAWGLVNYTEMTREEIESKLKDVVVSALDLEDLTAADIGTDVPLFGEGLGLDSIDALELGMAVKKAFGVTFSSDPAENRKIFYSVKTLADYVEQQNKGAQP